MPTIKGVRTLQEAPLAVGDKRISTQYGLEYIVLADNAGQGPITIRETPGLPLVGITSYSYNGESDLSAVCKRKTPRQDTKQRLVWYVTCEYDNNQDQMTVDEQNQPAADARPPEIEWDSEYGERVIFKDFSPGGSKPILSSNLEPYDPPRTTQIVYPILNVTVYRPTFTIATKLNYEGRVNSAAWNGAAAYTVKCAMIRARRVREGNGLYWQITFRFRYNPWPDGYWDMPLNQGTYRLQPVPSERPRKIPVLNGSGYGIINLTGNGQAEAPYGSETYGGPTSYIDDGGVSHPVTPGYMTHQLADFNGLGLTF